MCFVCFYPQLIPPVCLASCLFFAALSVLWVLPAGTLSQVHVSSWAQWLLPCRRQHFWPLSVISSRKSPPLWCWQSPFRVECPLILTHCSVWSLSTTLALALWEKCLWSRLRAALICGCKHNYLGASLSTNLLSRVVVVDSLWGSKTSRTMSFWSGLQYQTWIPSFEAGNEYKRALRCGWREGLL